MRNVNICFQDQTYEKIKDFVNQAVEEKIQKKWKQGKEELRQRLMVDYQAKVKNKELQNELNEKITVSTMTTEEVENVRSFEVWKYSRKLTR